MKIFQIIQKPQLRGAEIFASQLASHLTSLGHTVTLISIFSGDAQLPYKGRIIGLNRPLNKRLWDWTGWKKLSDLVRLEQPDIIQANAGDTLKFVVMSKITGRWSTPVIFRNANMISNFINTRAKYYFNRFFVNRLDYVISVSDLCKEDFQKTFLTDRIEAVPIGIETGELAFKKPQDLEGIFKDHPVLVNVASLVEEKNHEGLLRIFMTFLKSYPTAKLLIIGNGRLKEKIQKRIADKGLTSSVNLLGSRNDVADIIHHADVFLLPSKIEGLPGVILESFFCKTLVVAYNVGGVSEVVADGSTGLLIESGNEPAFENALKESMQKDFSKCIANAFDLVTNKFDNKIIATRFLKIYENVAALSSLKTGKQQHR